MRRLRFAAFKPIPTGIDWAPCAARQVGLDPWGRLAVPSARAIFIVAPASTDARSLRIRLGRRFRTHRPSLSQAVAVPDRLCMTYVAAVLSRRRIPPRDAKAGWVGIGSYSIAAGEDDGGERRRANMITLLERVSRSPADTMAWDEFSRCYRPKILQWCRGWGVQEADAEDVAQLVLAKMLKLLRDFQYNPAGSSSMARDGRAAHVWSDLRESHAQVVTPIL